MATIIERLMKSRETEAFDGKLLMEAAEEIGRLVKRTTELEEALIVLIRMGGHWGSEEDDENTAVGIREAFGSALREARKLVGLDHRSALTRTEPKT